MVSCAGRPAEDYPNGGMSVTRQVESEQINLPLARDLVESQMSGEFVRNY
jgi:hypothetical protein